MQHSIAEEMERKRRSTTSKGMVINHGGGGVFSKIYAFIREKS